MLDKNFIYGYITGEGCFTFVIFKYKFKNKKTQKVRASFSITTSIRDVELLKIIKNELDVGNVSILKQNYSCALQVYAFEHILKILDYFDGHLYGQKLKEFLIWKEGVLKLKEIKIREGYGTNFSSNELKYFTSLRRRNQK